MNRPLTHQIYYQTTIPCLHRLHDDTPVMGGHRIQHQLGMSISLTDFKKKLIMLAEALKQHNQANNIHKKALISFDDGYKDNLLAVPILQGFPEFQPVLFITGKQIQNDISPLPLTILYGWCDSNNINPNDMMADYGFDRQSLKQLPEDEQYQYLQKIDTDITASQQEMLTAKDMETLQEKGWLIGYHGHEHYDLRLCDHQLLQTKFARDIEVVRSKGYVDWLAWPEGRYNSQISDIARKCGFTLQFSLTQKDECIKKHDILAREIWR